MVKLVFADMDGTFLTSNKTITPRNMAVLDALAARQIQFVPCSGRNINLLAPELLDHPAVSYAVCGNGALICDAKTRSVLRELDIPKDVVRRLYERVRHLRVTFDLFTEQLVYTEAARFGYIDEVALSPVARETIKSGRTVYDSTADELLGRCGDVCRVNIFFHDDAERDFCWAAVDAEPELRRTSSLPCNIEITRKDAYKGAGVRWLCERLGVDVADTVAFGDSDNDLTMLEVAGDGVAMQNALPQCKAVADHICGSCDESGVAAYLEGLLGL